MGTASMVLGIIALVFGFIPFCGTWAIAPAVIGLGLGIADLAVKTRRREPRGTAIAGVIMNPLAILVVLLWYLLFVVGATHAAGRAANQLQHFPDWQPAPLPGATPARPSPPTSGSGTAIPVQPARPDEQLQPMKPVSPDAAPGGR